MRLSAVVSRYCLVFLFAVAGQSSLVLADTDAAQGQEQEQGLFLKKIVAVTLFENSSSFEGGGEVYVTAGLADQLTDALVRSGAFVVLERQTLADVIGEQDLAASGRTEAATETAATGRLTPAQILIKGTVTEFEFLASKKGGGIGFRGLRLGGNKRKSHMAIIIRLIDSTTGEVMMSHRVEGEAIGKGVTFDAMISGVDFDAESFKQTPIGKAMQQTIDNAVEIIVDDLRTIPFQARIIQVQPGRIVLSAGARNNIIVGTELTVSSVGEAFVDPFTGESLGSVNTDIGLVRIGQVFEKFSFAAPVGEVDGIKVGDLLVMR